MPPLFTIITPTFNSGDKLLHTIDSVLGQNRDLFEYWLIDGDSADQTPVILDSYGSQLRWFSEPDAGVYDAMNKGIRMANGRFLLFLGAGDRLLPGSLQKMEQFIGNHPSLKPRLIYGTVLKMENAQFFTSGHYSKVRLINENICHQGIFYERTIFDLLGGYELKYPVMADWAFNLRCFGDSRIGRFHFPATVAEFEGGGLSTSRPDIPFAHDRQTLIHERLGPWYAHLFRLRQAMKWRIRRFQRGN